jgi:hypothetical protein
MIGGPPEVSTLQGGPHARIARALIAADGAARVAGKLRLLSRRCRQLRTTVTSEVIRRIVTRRLSGSAKSVCTLR